MMDRNINILLKKLIELQNMSIEISIIIACRNEERDIQKCLFAIKAQTYPQAKFETIIIDGNSSDATTGQISKFEGKIRNLKLAQEKGVNKSAANARNQGASLARGKVVTFIDADIVIDKDYLREIAGAFARGNADKAHPLGLEAAASNVKSFPSKSLWASLREHETMASDYLVERGRGMAFPNIFTKKAFDGLGGYMAGFRYGEDLLLVNKLKKNGIKVVRLKKAILRHRDPDSLMEIAAQSKFWGGGFYSLFISDPKRHIYRLALVVARALWLPLFLLYLFRPFNLLLLAVLIFYLATMLDGAIILYRSLRMGGNLGHALLMVPFRMIRSFFFLAGFLGAKTSSK